MTLTSRSGESHLLRTFDSASPAMPIGIVAMTIHITN